MSLNEIDPAALTLIRAFRQKVPMVSERKVIHLNQNGYPPSNQIVDHAIVDHLVALNNVITPKEIFLSNLQKAKALLGELMHVDPQDLALTRDSSEGSELLALAFNMTSGDNIVMLEHEFLTLSTFWTNFCANKGVDLRLIPMEDQFYAAKAEHFEDYVDDNTKLIILSSVRYNSGTRNDIKGIARKFRPRGIHILADVCQEAGFCDLNLQDLGASAAVFSCFKSFFLPIGLGVLYIDPGFKKDLGPVYGSPDDSSTNFQHFSSSNIIVAPLVRILEFFVEVGMHNIEKYLAYLGHLLVKGLKDLNLHVVGTSDPSCRSCNSYVLPITNQEWASFLTEEKVVVALYTTMRLSVGIYNNEDDVASAVAVFKKGLEMKISLD